MEARLSSGCLSLTPSFLNVVLQTWTKPLRRRSRRSFLPTTEACWWPIPGAASPRSSVVLLPAPVTRSRTVNRSACPSCDVPPFLPAINIKGQTNRVLFIFCPQFYYFSIQSPPATMRRNLPPFSISSCLSPPLRPPQAVLRRAQGTARQHMQSPPQNQPFIQSKSSSAASRTGAGSATRSCVGEQQQRFCTTRLTAGPPRAARGTTSWLSLQRPYSSTATAAAAGAKTVKDALSAVPSGAGPHADALHFWSWKLIASPPPQHPT